MLPGTEIDWPWKSNPPLPSVCDTKAVSDHSNEASGPFSNSFAWRSQHVIRRSIQLVLHCLQRTKGLQPITSHQLPSSRSQATQKNLEGSQDFLLGNFCKQLSLEASVGAPTWRGLDSWSSEKFRNHTALLRSCHSPWGAVSPTWTLVFPAKGLHLNSGWSSARLRSEQDSSLQELTSRFLWGWCSWWQ